MQWVRELHLPNTNFEMDSKTVVDNIYRNKDSKSDLGAIIKDCRRHLLNTDLLISRVRFIMRQTNEVVHSLARAATPITSFNTYYISFQRVSKL
jgi:hypothetical protein